MKDPEEESESLYPKPPWVPAEFATPEGIVGVGGDLQPSTLLLAYASGIFPWFNPTDPVIWWAPDPRAIIPLDSFHVPKRLAQTIKQNRFQITVDTRFEEVIQSCGDYRAEGTWVTQEMVEAYTELHRLGHAHSLETWQDGELVGGIYGIAINGLFAGESMFYRVRDASKVALVALLQRLRTRGYRLFDTQILNAHTEQFGAVEIRRRDYMALLRDAIAAPASFS